MNDADLLRPLLSASRAARIDAVAGSRLGGLTLLLEHIHDEGNVSAILRTCEAVGVQRVHLLGGPGPRFQVVEPITQGCERWVDLERTRDRAALVGALRGRGFRIYGSYLGDGAIPLEALDFAAKAALVFGNEHAGITLEMRDLCDALFVIPMSGMTRSFNVSVAAGIALYHATAARRSALGRPSERTAEEVNRLRDRWYRAEVREAERVLARLRG